ncbi:MAG: GspH/FimT family pseudopilin [Candidatus Sumerlaeota bacterium]|nr:GspH/FimT family pseudopilin [Candidatus Sumerlaeota bacterium]
MNRRGIVASDPRLSQAVVVYSAFAEISGQNAETCVVHSAFRSCRSFRIPHSAFRIQGERGVTFLELMVVLTILSIFFMVAIPAMQGPHEKNKLRADARQLVSEMRYARSAAVLNQRDVILEIELNKDRYRLDLNREEKKDNEYGKRNEAAPDQDMEQWRGLNKNIHVVQVYSWEKADQKSGVGRIRFYADGSASAASIILRNKTGQYMTVVVNRATAEAQVFNGPPADWEKKTG